MEEVIESIINGQRKQALKQLIEDGYTFAELVEELLYQERYTEVLRMISLAITTGVMEINTKAVEELV